MQILLSDSLVGCVRSTDMDVNGITNYRDCCERMSVIEQKHYEMVPAAMWRD